MKNVDEILMIFFLLDSRLLSNIINVPCINFAAGQWYHPILFLMLISNTSFVFQLFKEFEPKLFRKLSEFDLVKELQGSFAAGLLENNFSSFFAPAMKEFRLILPCETSRSMNDFLSL